MILESIVFIGNEPFTVGIEVPELRSYVFFGSRLFEKIKEGLEILVWFPTWRDLDLLIRVALGRKENISIPPHCFKWKIEKIDEIKYLDELGHTKVKVVKYSGEFDLNSLSGYEISRGDALALEAAVTYSKLIKYPYIGDLHQKYWTNVVKAVKLGSKAVNTLTRISGKPRVLWAITGAYTWLTEVVDLILKLRKRAYIDVVTSESANTILEMRKISLEAYSGKEAFLKASSVVLGKYDIVIVAPATSNTVAKILYGQADTPATISATHALKIGLPVILLPTDYAGVIDLGNNVIKHPKIHSLFVAYVELLSALGYIVVKDPEELEKRLEKYIPYVDEEV